MPLPAIDFPCPSLIVVAERLSSSPDHNGPSTLQPSDIKSSEAMEAIVGALVSSAEPSNGCATQPSAPVTAVGELEEQVATDNGLKPDTGATDTQEIGGNPRKRLLFG